MAAHLLRPLAAHVGVIERRIFSTVGHVNHRIRFRAGHAVILTMFLAAAHVRADYGRRVAALPLSGIPAADIADWMLEVINQTMNLTGVSGFIIRLIIRV
jgi:hypothetical protein